jgi:hypothetical protein
MLESGEKIDNAANSLEFVLNAIPEVYESLKHSKNWDLRNEGLKLLMAANAVCRDQLWPLIHTLEAQLHALVLLEQEHQDELEYGEVMA